MEITTAKDETQQTTTAEVKETTTAAMPSTPSHSLSGSISVIDWKVQSFEELQTNLLLFPAVEEDGTGAMVQHCSLNNSLEGARLIAIQQEEPEKQEQETTPFLCELKQESFETILANLRKASFPLTLQFQPPVNTNHDDEVVEKEPKTPSSTATAAVSSIEDENHAEEKKTDEEQVPSKSQSPTTEATLEETTKNNQQADSLEQSSSVDPDSTSDTQKLTIDTTEGDGQQQSAGNSNEKNNDKDNPQSATKSPPTTPSTDDSLSTEEKTPNPARSTPPPQPSLLIATPAPPLSTRAHSFMSWASRVKDTVKEQAVSAYQQASSSPMISARPTATIQSSDNETANSPPPPVQLFYQNSVGAFLPIEQNTKNNNSKPAVLDNTTLLTIRYSVTQPCTSPSDQSIMKFQWFQKESLEEGEWIPLPGATLTSFQPTALQVGYYLQCRITISPQESPKNSRNLELSAQNDSTATATAPSMPVGEDPSASSKSSSCYSFTTPNVIAASQSLFNGARQALGRGGLFGGIKGRDKAQGREFRARIIVTKSANAMVAGLQLYQVSGGTSELIHGSAEEEAGEGEKAQHVLPDVSAAISDHSASQTHFQFTFPQGLSEETASMVKALCNTSEDDNDPHLLHALPVTAPNRMARESLLLCLGIANFQGRPVDLSPTTVLYPTTPEETSSCSLEDSKSVKTSQHDTTRAPAESVEAQCDRKAATDTANQNEESAHTQSEIGISDDDANDIPPPCPGVESTEKEISPLATSPDKGSDQTKSFDDMSLDALSTGNDNTSVEASEPSVLEARVSLPPKPDVQHSARRSNSLDASVIAVEAKRAHELEKEIAQLKASLQRSEKARERAQKDAKELSVTKRALNDTKNALRVAERRIESQELEYKRLQKHKEQQKLSLEKETLVQANKVKKCESTIDALRVECTSLSQSISDRDTRLQQLTVLERKVEEQASKIQEMEKTAKTLRNEKAVLQAGVDAREGKLQRLTELQSTNAALESKAKENHSLRNQLEESQRRYDELESEKKTIQDLATEKDRQLEEQGKRVSDLESRLAHEAQTIKTCRSDLDAQLLKIQKLKAERNSYKQKGDSLAKEMAQICRHGRTVNQVCKILADEPSRRQEVALLREQKRKALQELNDLRSMQHDQRVGVEKQSNDSGQRTAELERILAELTEYVSAKEMQLETCQQVNEALQQELARMSAIQMSKNLGKGDV